MSGLLAFAVRLARVLAANRTLVSGAAALLTAVLVVAVPTLRQEWLQLINGLMPVGQTQLVLPGTPPEAPGTACLSCHVDMERKLASKAVHRPFGELRCAYCHTDHAVNPDGSRGPTTLKLVRNGDQKPLCGSCHVTADQLAMSNNHVPFKNGWCSACHDPHGSDVEAATNYAGLLNGEIGVISTNSMLKVDPSQLCLNCHNMNLRYGFKRVQHRPFQYRACLACHVPHASNNAKNTRLPLPYLCMNCHPIIARDMSLSVLHPPFSQAWCTVCHSPHATNFPRMLKADDTSEQPVVDLCRGCHAGAITPRVRPIDLHISHPMGKYWKDGRIITDPLTGQQLSCISCHHPHSSNHPRMWRRDKDYLCLGCHRRLPGPKNMPW